MKTWPQLNAYSQYEQLRSLIMRGFAAILESFNLGVGQDAALACGKALIMERLMQPPNEIQKQFLSLTANEPLGPKIELTPQRLVLLKALLQETLSTEDWNKIAKAAAEQVHQQVMLLIAA
jgi:hypothetical protein